MPPYERHVFICENERPSTDPRGCCASKGSREIRARLKEKVRAAGFDDKVRINSAGCLDLCGLGVAVVVYPEGTWYGGVTTGDADELFQSHIVEGRPVERLRIPFMSGPQE
jgi:(2Fe-2S) ferredoxin